MILPCFAKKLLITGGKHIRSGRSGTNYIAEAIDAATLQVNAGKQRCRNAGLAVLEQLVGLFCRNDVAAEENHTRRLNSSQQRPQAQGYVGAIETDD